MADTISGVFTSRFIKIDRAKVFTEPIHLFYRHFRDFYNIRGFAWISELAVLRMLAKKNKDKNN